MNLFSRRHLFFAIGLASFLSCFGFPAAQAGVEISVDAETLTDLLSAMVPSGVSLPLVGDQRVTLQIEEVRVTGFEPTAGKNGRGLIVSALRLRVPELGLSVPVEPRLSLYLEEKDGRSTCHLIFEKVVVPFPLTGPVNIAPLLPRIPVPADNLTMVQSARGLFQVRTRLVETTMGNRALRFRFDLDVSPAQVPSPETDGS